MTYNINRAEKAKAVEPDEFIPWKDRFQDEMTVDDLRRKLGFTTT